jgi:hypothetical protein
MAVVPGIITLQPKSFPNIGAFSFSISKVAHVQQRRLRIDRQDDKPTWGSPPGLSRIMSTTRCRSLLFAW